MIESFGMMYCIVMFDLKNKILIKIYLISFQINTFMNPSDQKIKSSDQKIKSQPNLRQYIVFIKSFDKMNEEIQLRTQSKLKENEQIETHHWQFSFGQSQHSYTVLPGVFSPAIFMGTAWLTQHLLQQIPKGASFLEIGTGCGITSIEVALKLQCSKITATDINPTAIENALLNLKNFNCNFEVLHSDMFEKIPNEKYDAIYWNYPFHPSHKNPNTLTFLQKAVMDPQYDMLKKFMLTSSDHLKANGFILLGFSQQMGDISLLKELAAKFSWNYCEVARMIDGASMCLIKLSK